MDAETAESLSSVFESAIASVAGVDADSVSDLTFSSGRRRLDFNRRLATESMGA